jgi:hypothetical protein
MKRPPSEHDAAHTILLYNGTPRIDSTTIKPAAVREFLSKYVYVWDPTLDGRITFFSDGEDDESWYVMKVYLNDDFPGFNQNY